MQTTENKGARTRVTGKTRIEWNGSATFNVWQSGTTKNGYVNENVNCFTCYDVESVEQAHLVAEAWWEENQDLHSEERFI